MKNIDTKFLKQVIDEVPSAFKAITKNFQIICDASKRHMKISCKNGSIYIDTKTKEFNLSKNINQKTVDYLTSVLADETEKFRLLENI